MFDLLALIPLALAILAVGWILGYFAATGKARAKPVPPPPPPPPPRPVTGWDVAAWFAVEAQRRFGGVREPLHPQPQRTPEPEPEPLDDGLTPAERQELAEADLEDWLAAHPTEQLIKEAEARVQDAYLHANQRHRERIAQLRAKRAKAAKRSSH